MGHKWIILSRKWELISKDSKDNDEDIDDNDYAGGCHNADGLKGNNDHRNDNVSSDDDM